MKSVASVFRFVPSVIAACAIVSLYAFTQVDSIVNQTLYQYHLQFDNAWAYPYWDMAHVLDAMGLLIAGLAIATQAALLVQKAPPAASDKTAELEAHEEDRWSTFRLGDGSTIRVKLIVKGAKRLNKYSEDGWPVYTVDTEPIVEVVEVPDELKVTATTATAAEK